MAGNPGSNCFSVHAALPPGHASGGLANTPGRARVGRPKELAVAEPRNRYSTVSLTLHWLTAALVLTQVLLITAHEATEGPLSREFVQIHKSVGLTILVLTLFRIGWRVANPAIPLPDAMPRWQKLLARGTHVLFYVFLI